MRHEGEAAKHVCDDVDNGAAMLDEVLAVHLTGHQEGARQVRLYHSVPPLGQRERGFSL